MPPHVPRGSTILAQPFTLQNLGRILIHVLMIGIVCAIAAYWTARAFAPLPAPAAAVAAVPDRPPLDPVLAARMFGLVEQSKVRSSVNLEVFGVFVAGQHSSAVLGVDGKAPRAYLLGQNLASGMRLIDVRVDGVAVEIDGSSHEFRLRVRPTSVTDSVANAASHSLVPGVTPDQPLPAAAATVDLGESGPSSSGLATNPRSAESTPPNLPRRERPHRQSAESMTPSIDMSGPRPPRPPTPGQRSRPGTSDAPG